MSERKVLTLEQLNIQQEFINLHELDETQISFEGENVTPIFDYEAVCALSLKLTDIQTIQSEISDRDYTHGIITAKCEVNLPDGRTRVVEDSAQMGEPFGGDGKTIETLRLAELVAQARAVRRGIRSVGINLVRAHEIWKQSGQTVAGHTNHDPRKPQYDEIHLYAEQAGLIVNKEKTLYKAFLAENYDGRESARNLDDLELQRLLITLRSIARLKRVSNSVTENTKTANDTIQPAA